MSRYNTAVVADTPAIAAGLLKPFTPAGRGATGSMSDNDGEAIMAALQSGRKVYIDKPYRTTQKLTETESPIDVEFLPGGQLIFDVQNGRSWDVRAGSKIRGLSAKSLAYASDAISDSTDYDVFNRCIRLGSGTKLWDAYVTDLSAGIDITGASDVLIDGLKGDNIRQRYGWGALLHIAGSHDVTIRNIEGEYCDRLLECEDGSYRVRTKGLKASYIYPNGFDGQNNEAGETKYAGSVGIVADLGHDHEGVASEACHDNSIEDAYIYRCVGGVHVARSNGLIEGDIPYGMTARNIVIDSPEAVNLSAFGGPSSITFNPVHIGANSVLIDGIRFRRSRVDASHYGTLSRLVTALSYGRHTCIRNLEVDDFAYASAIVEFNAPDCVLDGFRIGLRSQYTTGASWRLLRALSGAHRAEFRNGTLYQPTYNDYLYEFASGVEDAGRFNTKYVPPSSNAPGAVVLDNSTGLRSDNNVDS